MRHYKVKICLPGLVRISNASSCKKVRRKKVFAGADGHSHRI